MELRLLVSGKNSIKNGTQNTQTKKKTQTQTTTTKQRRFGSVDMADEHTFMSLVLLPSECIIFRQRSLAGGCSTVLLVVLSRLWLLGSACVLYAHRTTEAF